MGTAAMPAPVSRRWRDGALVPVDAGAFADDTIEVADSWLVRDGSALAIDLHRARFAESMRGALDREPGETGEPVDLDGFWAAVLAAIPREGDWFPRIELQRDGGAPALLFRLRSAPARTSHLTIISHGGADPRTSPRVKGPDLAALRRVREAAARSGAGEVAILSPDGHVVEGAHSALLWWRGDALCAPSDDLDRVDSVTARSVIAVAAALGIDVLRESVTPAELDGLEIWAVNALHGIRIVTRWIDGPLPAEQPGRLRAWRERLGKLSRPLGSVET